jgi:hypothetical protein
MRLGRRSGGTDPNGGGVPRERFCWAPLRCGGFTHCASEHPAGLATIILGLPPRFCVIDGRLADARSGWVKIKTSQWRGAWLAAIPGGFHASQMASVIRATREPRPPLALALCRTFGFDNRRHRVKGVCRSKSLGICEPDLVALHMLREDRCFVIQC